MQHLRTEDIEAHATARAAHRAAQACTGTTDHTKATTEMILDEQQVRDIFLRQFAIFKRLSEKRGRAVASDDPMPWPGYAVSVERAEGIAAHTTPGVYPERLFSERAPNQTDKEAA